ncbi:MAG: ectonucleotide pyrophosphatase/phosphodiesterase [Rhodothermales bacterium]
MRPRSLIPTTTVLPVALLALLVFVSGCALQSGNNVQDAPPRLAPTIILVSLDGFRWNYLDQYAPPVLTRLAAEGVRAERLIPVFPTKTFPNHYTLVTGLYPEHHGIVGNSMYDPDFDISFRMSDREAVQDERWWRGEPIWITLENQGQKSAPFFWVGSEVEIQGVRPSYWMPFDESIPAAERVEQILTWLDLPPDQRPTFLTLYFSDLDSKSHRFGPDSNETVQAVRDVDRYLGRLVDGLEQRGLYHHVNLIVVSDHGMVATSSERVLILDDYIDLDDVHLVTTDPVVMLRPVEGKMEAVYNALKAAPHLSVYRREEIPDELHYRAHRRITPIVGIADEGWRIATRNAYTRNPSRFDGGMHGYDHRLVSMHTLFVARGPAFAQGLTVEPFANIHVYPLMTSILGVEPAPNDGDLGAVRHLLRPAGVLP